MKPRGFTLIELLVSLAVLAALAMLVVPVLELHVQRRKELALERALWELRGAIDAYKAAADKGLIAKRAGDSGYPPDLETLVNGVPDLQSEAPGVLVKFLRRVPRDPFCEDPEPSLGHCWATREYASPADAPREGDDVYDVYSRSTKVGINGIPYSRW